MGCGPEYEESKLKLITVVLGTAVNHRRHCNCSCSCSCSYKGSSLHQKDASHLASVYPGFNLMSVVTVRHRKTHAVFASSLPLPKFGRNQVRAGRRTKTQPKRVIRANVCLVRHPCHNLAYDIKTANTYREPNPSRRYQVQSTNTNSVGNNSPRLPVKTYSASGCQYSSSRKSTTPGVMPTI